MEPKALANLNGMLVPTPMKNATSSNSRECHTAPSTPANRRDSSLWIRTPEDDRLHEDGEESEWDMGGMLTPVPKTPAPEAIARFAAAATPAGSDTDDAESMAGVEREELLMRTCPPKTSVYHDLGEGVLSRDKDQGVMMRLMAARRKSLQYAPKIGSPLSKAWA